MDVLPCRDWRRLFDVTRSHKTAFDYLQDDVRCHLINTNLRNFGSIHTLAVFTGRAGNPYAIPGVLQVEQVAQLPQRDRASPEVS